MLLKKHFFWKRFHIFLKNPHSIFLKPLICLSKHIYVKLKIIVKFFYFFCISLITIFLNINLFLHLSIGHPHFIAPSTVINSFGFPNSKTCKQWLCNLFQFLNCYLMSFSHNITFKRSLNHSCAMMYKVHHLFFIYRFISF